MCWYGYPSAQLRSCLGCISGFPNYLFLWLGQIVEGRDSCELLLTRGKVLRTKRKGAVEVKGWAPYDQVYCMNQACEAAGLPPFTLHEFRHTCASALVNHGVPLAYVAAQLGHSDTRMVERYYRHLSPNAQADSVRSLTPKLGISEASKVQALRIAGIWHQFSCGQRILGIKF
jgi:Phage integrase family